jgi:glycosyltransferase involved in cell wall biosynthesis
LKTHRVLVVLAICTRSWAAFSKSKSYFEVESQIRQLHLDDVDVQLLIVDNSGLISTHQSPSSPSEGKLIVEPRLGIPFARNAALDESLRLGAEWMIFLDDDTFPRPDWLRSTLTEFASSGADVQQGVTKFIYPDYYPDHYPRIPDREFPRGTVLMTGSTANVILRTEPVRDLGLRFNEKLVEYGGSDAEFFFRLHQAGFRILHSNASVVTELLEGARASLLWQFKRRIRTSQSWFYAIGGVTTDGSGLLSQSSREKWRPALMLIGKFVWASGLLILQPRKGRGRFLASFMDLAPLLSLVLIGLRIRIKEYRQR